MYEDIDVRLEAATSKAENASGIMHDVANGAAGQFVTTESGQVPTIPEFLKQLDDEINTGADSILTGATQAKNDAEGFRDESEQFLIQTGNLAQEVSNNKDITDQNVVTSTEQATIATEQAVIAQEAADQAIANTNITYMQASPTQLDEYGYPNKTLYENGDGFITYYPEYAVFRKDGGIWEHVTPHLRNVLTFNGISQHAVAPRVSEIDLDDPTLEFEVEFTGMWGDLETVLSTGDPDTLQNDQYKNELKFTNLDGRLHVSLGGEGWGSVPDALPLDGNVHNYMLKVKREDGASDAFITIEVDNKVTSRDYPKNIATFRSTQESLYIGAWLNASAGGVDQLYKGQLSNIKIWTGGDRNTGTLTRHYRMDEGWRGDNNQVLVNYATELGEELVVNGTFDENLDGWDIINDVTWVDGEAHFGVNTLGARNSMTQPTTAINKTVLVSFGGSTYGTGQNLYLAYVGFTSANIEYRGTGSVTGYLDVDVIDLRDTNLNVQTGISSISVRQADGYGTYIGLTEASWAEEEV